jgi:hypothetical protein
MTAQAKIAAETTPGAGPFVVNLCSSTSPMALTHPDTPELKRFSFFMSRRREEGRERFRLHMGYFMTMAEAEEMLNLVRDIYPGAWAGEAPGKKLAERAAAAAAPKVPTATLKVVEAAPDQKPVATAPAEPVTPQTPAPAAHVLPEVPTLQAASNFAAAPAQKPASVQKSTVIQKSGVAPKPAIAEKPAVTVAAKPKAPAAASKTPFANSNVKEVLKSLDETDETQMMPAPAKSLSDSQVLKILEDRQSGTKGVKDDASKGIALLRPDDTATVRALKDAVQSNAPVSFAVQLHWSVQPIELAKVPPLAIFSAYTLYTVEGSRDGRKWYGLRLGFFSDAVSAKQVASYVRSEFTSVAVIPVNTQERDRATDGDKKAAAPASSGTARARKTLELAKDEFKLLDDQTDEAIPPALAMAQAQMKAKKSAPTPAARKQTKKSGGKVVRATEKRSPKTLEETLEILGAGQLEIDNGRGELLNESGVRHLTMQRVVQKNSPFAKLLERLSERGKKA